MAVIAVQRNYTYGLTVNLTTMECWSCGVVYAVPNRSPDNRTLTTQGERDEARR